MQDEETSPYGEPSAQPAGPRRSRIFYGWYLVAAAALISAAVAGVNDGARVLTFPISTTVADGHWGSSTVLKSQRLASAEVSNPNEIESNPRPGFPNQN